MRDYCLVSRALVSFVQVDRHATAQAEPASEFRINDSWVEWLARGSFNTYQSAGPVVLDETPLGSG